MTPHQLQQLGLFLNNRHNYSNSDSHRFFLFLRENRTLISILTANYKEFNDILRYHNSDIVAEKFRSTDPSFRFKLQKRIIRLLSNYLSSLFTVVDYSRNSINNYLLVNETIYKEYNAIKDEHFTKDGNHRFIQDLRNYISHNTYLKIGSEFSYNIEWTEPTKSIYIQKDELLKSDKWCSLSKSLIEREGEKIRLNKILSQHFEKFLEFQNWIYMRILLVNNERTQILINDLQKNLDEAVSVNQPHLLIYNQSYIRYIKWVYYKALHTTLA